jgi:hypothetical protein
VWAYIYAALTGAGLRQAGADAVALFAGRGWSAYINDDLVGSAMRVVSITVGFASALAGAGVAYFSLLGEADDDRAAASVLGSLVGGLAGAGMAFISTGVLVSATRTVFVAFAMNPAALRAHRPDLLAKLADAWGKAQPAAFAPVAGVLGLAMGAARGAPLV